MIINMIEIINENKKEEIKERVIEESIVIDGKLDEKMTNKFIKKNVKNIMYEFINSNATNTWPDSTNTHCWWCCHKFDGCPCTLPTKYDPLRKRFNFSRINYF